MSNARGMPEGGGGHVEASISPIHKVLVTAECHAFRLLRHSFLAPKKLQANKSRVGFPAAAGKSKEV